jgi:hydrogenase maturation protease
VIDDLAEAEVAFVVDACRSGAPPGTVRRVEIGDDPLVRGPTRYSSHGLGVAEAIELARALGRLPRRLVVFSIEGQDFRLGAGLSAPVKEATRAVADRILDEAKSLQGLKG